MAVLALARVGPGCRLGALQRPPEAASGSTAEPAVRSPADGGPPVTVETPTGCSLNKKKVAEGSL